MSGRRRRRVPVVTAPPPSPVVVEVVGDLTRRPAYAVSLLVRDTNGPQHLVEVVEVLPVPGPVLVDDHVEPVVAGVERIAVPDDRHLEVDVPTERVVALEHP